MQKKIHYSIDLNENIQILTCASVVFILLPWRSICSYDAAYKADSKFLNGFCSRDVCDLSLTLNLFACWAKRSRIWRSSRLLTFVTSCDGKFWWFAKYKKNFYFVFFVFYFSYMAVDDDRSVVKLNIEFDYDDLNWEMVIYRNRYY